MDGIYRIGYSRSSAVYLTWFGNCIRAPHSELEMMYSWCGLVVRRRACHLKASDGLEFHWLFYVTICMHLPRRIQDGTNRVESNPIEIWCIITCTAQPFNRVELFYSTE